jgi:hypothetical protein
MATATGSVAWHSAPTGYVAVVHGTPSSRVLALQALATLVVLSVTVFNRFGINLGPYSLSFSLIFIYALVAVALVSGELAIAPRRFLGYCACVVVATASFILNTSYAPIDRSSWTSLLLLAVIYFPLVFALRSEGTGDRQVLWTIRMFSNIALFCAFAGIAQFYAQFVISGDWLFDFTPHIPIALQAESGFNTVIPMGYESSVHKSNGFFFREPSGASFIMALALVVEIALFHRPLRMVALTFALLLTYSGTGLLALLIGLALSVRWRTIGRMSFMLAIAGLCLWASSDFLNLSFTLDRIDEFGNEHSSAYMRYVAPMRLVSDVLFSQPWSVWLGLGPGTILRLSQDAYVFHDPTWAKLLVEYGVLGFAAFVALMLVCVQQRSLPVQIKAVLFFSWLVMGGHLLSPDNVYLAFLLTGLLGPVSSAASGGRPEHTGKVGSADDEDVS